MLPGYEIKNALVDFSPVTNAIESNQQNALARRKLDQEDARFGLERERHGAAMADRAEQKQMRQVQRWGMQAQVIDEMTDGPQKQALSQQFYSANPDLVSHASKIGVNPQDPKFWKFLRAEAGNYDPLKQREAEARIAASNSSTNLHNIQAKGAQRELDNPADNIQKVKDADGNEYLVRVPKRQGEEASVVYQPQPAAAPGDARPISDPKKKAEVEHTLRTELQKLSGDYRTVRDASGNLEGLGQNNTAAGDIALIYSFMKILDPSSVVRETEFATAQNAAGVPDQVRNVFNRVLEGTRLGPDQRKDFLNQARTIAAKQLGQYQRTLDQYKGVAQRSGVDQRNVIIDQDLMSPPGQTASGNSTVGTPLNGAPAENAPVLTPDQARRAPPGTVFRSTDGRILRVPAR